MSGAEQSVPGVRRGGFSLIEVIVAIVILTVGVLGLAGTTAFMIRQVTLSDLMTERTIAFQTVFEQLQSAPYGSMATGTDSVGIYQVDWSSVNNGSQSMTVTVVTTGPGLGTGNPPMTQPNVVDTFQFRLLRR